MLVVTAVTTRIMIFHALLVMALARLAPAAVQIARQARPGACVAGVEGLAMEPANPPCFLPVAFAGVACGRHGGGAAKKTFSGDARMITMCFPSIPNG